MEFPKLRPVEAVPALVSGRQVAVLRDPSGVAEISMPIPEDVLYVLQFFDGQHSLLDIRTEYMRKFGSFLFEDRLNELIAELDERLLLESESFERRLKEIKASYAAQTIREPSHAGSSYEDDPAKLRATLTGYFESAERLQQSELRESPVAGMIVPHIDLRVGGRRMATGYREVVTGDPPDLFIILGTGHGGAENFFAMTRKDFRTPLGLTRTDRDFLDRMSSGTKTDFFADELAHKLEHSVEFQVLLLQYLWSERVEHQDQPLLVPILCSFGFGDLEKHADTPSYTKIEDFVTNLTRAIEECGKRVCVIASADLAHLGPRYGDSVGIGDGELSIVKADDMELCSPLGRGDREAFVQLIARQNDRRRVCGFSPIYTLLSVLKPRRGTLVCYDQTRMDNQGSVVSFATMVFD